MKDNILRIKPYAFALKVIKAYKQIVAEHREYILSKQFLKAGTALGALVRESEYVQSKADFVSKLSIALKESNEAEYWTSLLRDSMYMPDSVASELLTDNAEITRLLVSSINTSKRNLKK